jgi:hypothetical protein
MRLRLLLLLALLPALGHAQTSTCATASCVAQLSWVSNCPQCTVNVYAGPVGAACNPQPAFTLIASGVPAAGPWQDSANVIAPSATFERCYLIANVSAVGGMSPRTPWVEVRQSSPPPPTPTGLSGSVVVVQ